jgi:hypothetical protein
MLTINPSSSLIIYVMTATNKRLPISESHGDLNQCTPCREKPDQHATRFPRLVCVWSTTTRISCGPHIATVHTIINRFEKIHCTREEGLLTQSTARRLTDPRVCTQLLSHNSPWSSGEKSSFYWHLTTRLTGPISPACDRYVQYLLTGANPSVLHRHRQGYNLGGANLPHTTPRPSPPAVSTFHLRALPGLQFNQVPSLKPKCWVLK